jgi:uncharacterized membrane protein YkvA (DUF1232 family)
VSAATAVAWLCVVAGVYAAFVLALVVAGRREDAKALARFVPDCGVLAGRLLRDPRVARRHKLTLALLVAYLASPIDLVPDVIPVAGQLDDAILVWLALRAIRRSQGGAQLVREHWPGRGRAPV